MRLDQRDGLLGHVDVVASADVDFLLTFIVGGEHHQKLVGQTEGRAEFVVEGDVGNAVLVDDGTIVYQEAIALFSALVVNQHRAVRLIASCDIGHEDVVGLTIGSDVIGRLRR